MHVQNISYSDYKNNQKQIYKYFIMRAALGKQMFCPNNKTKNAFAKQQQRVLSDICLS